ncbi:hypothetical protein BGZ65_010445, partial [Modicella reniformis]
VSMAPLQTVRLRTLPMPSRILSMTPMPPSDVLMSRDRPWLPSLPADVLTVQGSCPSLPWLPP